jgi:mRNA-degrading endonuclease RelE of RelBE toxin-antitoxin system
MLILQSASFRRSVKKLHANQKKTLDKAVNQIVKNLEVGDLKVGDLEGVRVYKFTINNLKWLLAYEVISKKKIVLLLLGPHENFYRELKR